ncbi:MAG TPA: dihydrolipoamide acetyltransferase family protein [Chloroflexota bacterium]|nr:dihydrolipoamide acetyltransferase family protein [Chloroflexota bacterium]
MSETLVRMPKLADTLVEGTLGQWLKQVGDTVGQGEPLASIETDKVTTEMPSPAAGTLLELLVPEGQTVPVETVIARIGSAVESVALTRAPEGPGSRPAPTTPTPAAEPQQVAPLPYPGAGPRPASPRPTPVAARLLAEHGLTPEQVPSRSGRLTKDEVLSYLERRPGAGAPGREPRPLDSREGAPTREGQLRAPVLPVAPRGPAGDLIPLTPMRRAIADHMSQARQTIPHGQTVRDADLSRLVVWRDVHKAAFEQAENANLSFTVCFVAALARALAPDTDGPVHIGVAVALEAGLIVPVLRGAEALGLGATARGIADLAVRARARTLTAADTLGAQMTVTNVGSFANLSASPIVPLGQVAILGPGLVERRPMPAPDGGIRPGWRCRLTLMFDRRALDDLAADGLLRRITDHLLRLSEAPPG